MLEPAIFFLYNDLVLISIVLALVGPFLINFKIVSEVPAVHGWACTCLLSRRHAWAVLKCMDVVFVVVVVDVVFRVFFCDHSKIT